MVWDRVVYDAIAGQCISTGQERKNIMERMQGCIKLRIGSRTVPVRSAQEEECVQLAGAVVKREQAPRTPNASRGSSSATILAACEPPRLVQRGEKSEGEGVQSDHLTEGGGTSQHAVIPFVTQFREGFRRRRAVPDGLFILFV